MESNFENAKVLQVLNKHINDVTSCDFAPNFLLVTSSTDKTVRVWEWITGSGYVEKSYSPLLNHKFLVTCVKISQQGCMLATASVDGTTVLWNTHSGSKIHVFVQINRDAVRCCRFSGDSSILVTTSDNGAICVWDLIHKILVKTVTENEGTIQTLAFTPDSKYLVTGCSQEKIKVWLKSNLADSTDDQCLLLYTFNNAHDLGILSLDISNKITIDESNPFIRYYTLATSGNSKKIKIWRMKAVLTPKCEDLNILIEIENINSLNEHQSTVTYVKYNYYDDTLFSCSLDKTIKIWNEKGFCVKTLAKHERYVNCMALSKDCSILVSGSNDKSVIVWDLHGILTLQSELFKQSTDILASAFEVPEDLFVENNTFEFELIGKLEIAEASINSCHFSVGNVLAEGSSDKIVKLFSISETNEIEELKSLQINSHTYPVLHVEFSKSGRMLATCSLDGCTVVWEASSMNKIFELPQNKLGIKDCRFSADEEKIIIACDDENAYVWDITHKRLILNIKVDFDSVTSTCFAPDDAFIVTVGNTGGIKFWNLDGSNILSDLDNHDLGINFCEFSENIDPNFLISSKKKHNYLLATCGNDNLVKLWIIAWSKNTQSAMIKNWRTFEGHGGNVMCVRFSPSLSELLCSGATDNQLRVWSIYSGSCLQVLDLDSYVNCCCFNFNCSLLSAGCLDKTLWIWKIPEQLTSQLSFIKKGNIHRKSVDDWNNQDVIKWLKFVELQRLAEVIKHSDLNGEKLLMLNDRELFEEFHLDDEQVEIFFRELNWLKQSEQNKLSTFKSSDLINAPDRFFCPITHEIMIEPVTCADGYVYEKRAINEWFMCGKFTSPMTNQILKNSEVVIHNQLKKEIQDYLTDIKQQQ